MALDFILTYADRTHHGKEEEILFRDRAKKDLTADLNKIMQELLDEHMWGSKTTAQMVAAKYICRGMEKSLLQSSVWRGIWKVFIHGASIPDRNISTSPSRKICWPNFWNSTAKRSMKNITMSLTNTAGCNTYPGLPVTLIRATDKPGILFL